MTAGDAHGVDLERLRSLFLEEALEHAQALEAGVLALEDTPDDVDLVNDVFRAAHSLKGAAGSVGFTALTEITHALETLLDCWRAGEIAPTRAHADALLRACDGIRALLADGQAAQEAELSPELKLLAAELEGLSSPEKGAGAAPPRPGDASNRRFVIRFVPRPEAFQWGADPLLVIRELTTLAASIDVNLDLRALPSLAALEAEVAHIAWEITIELLPDVERSTLDEAFSFVEGVADIEIEAAPAEISGDTGARPEPSDTGLAPPGDAVPPRITNDAATIRVATEKIDKLVDLVGELVIAHSAVRELSRNATPDSLPQLQQAVLHAERHLRDLQERVMSVRMVPVGNVFSRLPRAVREIASKLGKQVQLTLQGTETELDKGLAERLGDPLLHLVRNALDHGIEAPEQRTACGKPAAGRLQILARPRGGSVVVEVSDDGRGLDRAKILRKAVERGLVESSANLSDEQVYALISSPGFSTADSVTDLSGRGVGLDVVKRNIEEIGGELSIWSEPGRGCTFTIRLPLTLTIMDGLLLQAGNTVCVIPLVDVAFSLRLREGQLRSLAGLGEILDLPDESLPVLALDRLLGNAGFESAPKPLAVVLQTGAHRFALTVDALLGQTQVVVKSLETHFRRLPGILGATILGDGRVALILDGVGMAAAHGLTRSERHAAPGAKTHEVRTWN